MEFTNGAVDRAKDGALEWLSGDPDGYPRSWEQEKLDGDRYEPDFEAPPIAGYEALEREGKVVRMETVKREDGARARSLPACQPMRRPSDVP